MQVKWPILEVFIKGRCESIFAKDFHQVECHPILHKFIEKLWWTPDSKLWLLSWSSNFPPYNVACINNKPRQRIYMNQYPENVSDSSWCLKFLAKYSEYEYIVWCSHLLNVVKNVSLSRFGVKLIHSKAFINMLSVLSCWNMKQTLYNVIKNTDTGNTWYLPMHVLRYSSVTSGKYILTAGCRVFWLCDFVANMYLQM